jgi:trans-AT polyketide synthase/acyltransferase/oxidoreductase domain-containing protein
MRDETKLNDENSERVGVGAGGGIGTPEAAAAAFIMGADFIVTGSINQCTIEAGTSAAVKEMLQNAEIQDTDYAPAADMLDLGAKVQVFKKGIFFPARANKLYDLYRSHNSLEEIDDEIKSQIQEKYFKKSFSDIYENVVSYHQKNSPDQLIHAEKDPKYKMLLIFKWYFSRATKLALEGADDEKVDFQIPCGPSLGALNRWVKGTNFESWRNRKTWEIGKLLMEETAVFLNRQIAVLGANNDRYCRDTAGMEYENNRINSGE